VKNFVVLALVALLTGVGYDAAVPQQPTQEQPLPEQTAIKKDVPIVIKADRMSGDRKAGWVVFEGNVVATQEDAVLTSEKLTVHFTEDRKISLVIAEGKVNFIQGDRKGRCEKATYYYRERRMLFEGNPVVAMGKDIVSGAAIEVDLNTDKVSVLSSEGKRVEAVIFPEEGDIGETLYPESGQGVSGPQGGGSGQP